MNKSEFKLLCSEFRGLRGEGVKIDDRVSDLLVKQDLFCHSHSFNFRKTRKPDARTGIVSMSVASKLDFPSWCFIQPVFN